MKPAPITITPRSQEVVVPYFREVKRCDRITKDEERELALRAKAGDASAEEALVLGNLRYVITLANKYKGNGVSFEDLIGYGNMGLLEAVKVFDPNRGFLFMSFACFYAEMEMKNAVRALKGVCKLPANIVNLNKKIKKYMSAFMAENDGSLPTARETADILGLREEDVNAILLNAQYVPSIDDHLGDSGEFTIGDTLTNQALLPDEELELSMRESLFGQELAARLSERDLDIVARYYGLGSYEKSTLKEIGAVYNLKIESVRQVLKRSIEKLRSSSVLREMYAA